MESGEISNGVLYDICEYGASANELSRNLKGDFKYSQNYLEKLTREFVGYVLKLTKAAQSSSALEKEFIITAHNDISKKFPELRDESAEYFKDSFNGK